MIEAVTEVNIRAAATVHSRAWQSSHGFCAPDFVAAHTPERQETYLREKLRAGSRVYLLSEEGSLIADLYILPERQNQGRGTALLRYAVARCEGVPTLWILETNHGAERLYRREGFKPTGKRKNHPNGPDEIEFRLE